MIDLGTSTFFGMLPLCRDCFQCLGCRLDGIYSRPEYGPPREDFRVFAVTEVTSKLLLQGRGVGTTVVCESGRGGFEDIERTFLRPLRLT